MTQSDGFRRYPDGSTDFDFYRRRAKRLRHVARRAALLRSGRALRQTARATRAILQNAVRGFAHTHEKFGS